MSGLLAVAVLLPAAPAAAQFSPFQEVLADFDAEVAREVARDAAGCVSVAVFEGDRILWARGWGWADVEAGVPCTPETIGRTGSISKSFTAVAMMLLVERGVLDLDDPVVEVLPELDGLVDPPGRVEAVTFRRLASHTAGLVREPGLEGAATGPIHRWEERLLESIPTTGFDSPPGTGYSYSNIGFGFLGLALSRVAGVPFMELVETHLFEPLAMGSSTFIVNTPEMLERLSVGYTRSRRSGRVAARRATNEHLGRGYKVPNGGIYSTVGDLARFAASLSGHGPVEILSAESRRRLFTPQPPAEGYGLGFTIRQVGGRTVVGHGGSVAGYDADLAFALDSGLGVAMLRTTTYNPPTTRLLDDLLAVHGRTLTRQERRAEGESWREATVARRRIESLNRQMERAFRNGELADVAAFYADDAVLLGPGTRVEGRQAVDAYWAGIAEPVDWRLEVRDVTGTGEVVHQTGRSRLVTRHEGEERTSVVDFFLVWRLQEDGEYRIVVDSYHPPGR